MTRFLRPLLTIAATGSLAVSGLVASGAVSAAPVPTYMLSCGVQSVKPSRIIISCADANRLVTSIHWTSWGGATATATGTLEWNNCTPTCVSGRFLTKAISFKVSGLKTLNKKSTYTTMAGPAGAWGEAGTTWTQVWG